MITVEEMRKLLADEYGITSDKQLDEALKSLGGIVIDVFTQMPSDVIEPELVSA